MNSRASGRALRVIAVTAAVATGGLAELGLAATAASGVSGPSLIASRHLAGLPAVSWGQSLKLSGHESGGGTQSVVLQAQVFPFTGGYGTVSQSRTSGSYAFSVKPNHATRYRVLVGSATSRVVTVYVIGKKLGSSCNLCGSAIAGRHTLVVKGRVELPPGPLVIRGPLYAYYGLHRGSHANPRTLHLIETVRLHVNGNVLSGGFRYRVDWPHTAFGWLIATCFKDQEAKDGLGLPGHHHCGEARIPVGAYLG